MKKLLGLVAGLILSVSLFTTAEAKVDSSKYAYATATVVVSPVVHRNYRHHHPYRHHHRYYRAYPHVYAPYYHRHYRPHHYRYYDRNHFRH